MFDWADYLTLAKELAQRNEEAAQRSAVSRAYYAAYHKARNRLSQQGIVIPRTSHWEFWNIYREELEPAAHSIGVEGDRMLQIRNKVDYRDTVSDLSNEMRKTIARAEKLLEQLLLLP